MAKIKLGLDAEGALKTIEVLTQLLKESDKETSKVTSDVTKMFEAIKRGGSNADLSSMMPKNIKGIDDYVNKARIAANTYTKQQMQDIKNVMHGLTTLRDMIGKTGLYGNNMLDRTGMSGKNPLSSAVNTMFNFQKDIAGLYNMKAMNFPKSSKPLAVTTVRKNDKFYETQIQKLSTFIDQTVVSYIKNVEDNLSNVTKRAQKPFLRNENANATLNAVKNDLASLKNNTINAGEVGIRKYLKPGMTGEATRNAILADLERLNSNTKTIDVNSKKEAIKKLQETIVAKQKEIDKENQGLVIEKTSNSGLLKKAEAIRTQLEQKKQIQSFINRASKGGILAGNENLDSILNEHKANSVIDVKNFLTKNKNGSYSGIPAGNLNVYAKSTGTRFLNSILIDEMNKDQSAGIKAKLLTAYDDAKRVIVEKLTSFVADTKDKLASLTRRKVYLKNDPRYKDWDKVQITSPDKSQAVADYLVELQRQNSVLRLPVSPLSGKTILSQKDWVNNLTHIEKQGEKAGEAFQEGFEKGKKKKQEQQDNSGTGSGKGGRSSERIRGRNITYDVDRYNNDPDYRKAVDELKVENARVVGAYEASQAHNAWRRGFEERNAPLNNAKKAMAVASKYYSLAGMGSMPTENFAEAFEQKLAQNLLNGLRGRLDLGLVFGDALINRRRSKAFAGVFDQYALESTMLKDTEVYKKFKNSGVNKDLSDLEFLGLLKNNKSLNKKFLSQLGNSSTDSAIVMGGLAQNKGAMKAMQAAGIGAALPIVAGAVAVKKLADAVGNLSKESLQAYEKIQTLQTQLGVVFGSDVESNAMFQQIAAFAKRSPVGVETQTEQAVLLKQSGVYAADLMDTMKRLTDLASGNNQRMKSLSEVYARVMSSTTVTARDMRQLANAGVPSYAALADATGIERGQIRSKLQSGKITSEDFQKMIQNLTNQGGMFYNATERSARTIAEKRQNLGDAKQLERAALGEWLTKLGGNTTQNSWYGQYLSFMEKFYDMVETQFHISNSDKREKAYKSAVKDYERMKKEGASDETLAKKEAEINALYGESLAAGADKYDILKNLAGRDFTEKEVRQLRNDIIMSTAPSDEGTVVSYNRSALGGMSEGIFLRATEDIENMFTGRNQKLLSGITQQGYKNLDSAINSSTGGQMALANARQAWEAGELGKYAQTVKDEIKANEWRAKYAEFESKTYDKQNKTHDLSRLNATELERMSQFIYSDTDTIKFGLPDLLDADKNLKEGAKDELSALGENYTVLLKAIENSDSEHLEETAEQIKTILEILNGDWDKDAEGLGKSLASQVVALSDVANKEQKAAEEALKALPSNATEAERKAAERRLAEANANVTNAQNATQKAVISTEDANKLNARLQASAWAQVLSKMTGIDATKINGAEGVAGLGGARTMSLYRDNISQRQMFSSVGKAILAQGGSLKELSSILTRNYKGTDSRGRGLFDWRSAGGAIERLALNGNSDTQQALINAYQNQIDALDELTVGSVATADTWENLTDTAKYLGTAFTLTADTMADGSVRFTEATVRAANEMREELSAKKLSATISNTILKGIEGNRAETLGNRIQTEAYRGNLSGTAGFDSNKALEYSNLIAEEFKTLKNSEDGLNAAAKIAAKTPKFVELANKYLGKNYQANVTTVDTGVLTNFSDTAIKDAKEYAMGRLGKDRNENGFLSFNDLIEQYLKQYAKTTKLIYNNSGEVTGATYVKSVSEEVKELLSDGKKVTEQTISDDINNLIDKISTGNLSAEQMNEIINLLKVISPELSMALSAWSQSYDEKKTSANETESAKEIKSVSDSVIGLLSERGFFGLGKQSEFTNKAFSQMSSTNPLNNSLWNSSVEEEWLAQMGLPTTARYKEARKRLAEIMPKDDNYYTEIGAFLSSKMSVKELLNPLENLGFQNRILEYNARNGTDYSEDSLSDMARGIKNEDGSINTEKASEFLNIMKDIGYSEDAIVNKFIDWINVETMLNSEMQKLGSTMKSALKDFTSGAILNTSKKFGKDMYQVWVYEKDQQKAMEGIKKSLAAEGAQLLDNISKQMVDTGLKIAANGAMSGNPSLIAGGLLLAAAGGVGSFASGLLSAYSSDTEKNKTDDSIEKLQNLKESLADLLKQARDDAKYYEETLRSKKALAVTSDMSTTKVNDMILTPQGKFSTAPDDYIMAMKDPASLRGSGSPSVNVQIVNQSGTQLNVQRTVQTQRSDGGLDIKMIVNGVVKQAMASGEYDDAMMAMQMNNRGRSTYA